MATSRSPAGAPDAASVPWGRALSWASYDFANTIYSALVVSFAITLHVKAYTGVEKFTFITLGASLLASGLVLPLAGEAADRTGGTKRYLMAATLAACLACASITWARSAALILALFFVANFCYNTSFTFYDSLLPTVAPPSRLGLVSGIGVGLGYAGVAFALPLGWLLMSWRGESAPQRELAPLFALAGALYLVFSLPLFLFVPDRPASRRAPARGRLAPLVFKRVMVTVRALPRHRPMLLFLVGNFLLVDTLNTGIVAYAPYVVNVFGVGTRAAMLWMIPFSLGAFVLGAAGGRASDRFGSRRTLLAAGGCVFAAVVVCGLARSFAVFMAAFILLGGFGLSTIWVAGRKLLVELAPPGQVGKYFGLYNVGHKLSMVGPVIFGVLADVQVPGVPAGGYRLGLLSQLALLVPGIFCIYKLEAGHAPEH